MTKNNAQTKETAPVVEAPQGRTVVQIPLTKTEWAKIIEAEKLQTVSSQIRYLASNYPSESVKYGHIARFLNKRVQHVRQVLTTPIKK